MNIGWERKIGYSLVGLMAGNAAAAAALLLIFLLPRLGLLPGLARVWNPTTPMLFFFIAMVSMLGWALIGLPFVLLLRAESAADFYWPVAAFIGGILGVLGMLLFCVVMDRGLGTVSNAAAMRQIAPIFGVAALIGAVAFVVYCSRIKAALKDETKESDALKGTPRSLPWFDF